MNLSKLWELVMDGEAWCAVVLEFAPRDSSPPGSPIPGILQARTLEWVAIAFSIV